MKSKKSNQTAPKPKIQDLTPTKDAKGGGTVIQQERTASFFHS